DPIAGRVDVELGDLGPVVRHREGRGPGGELRDAHRALGVARGDADLVRPTGAGARRTGPRAAGDRGEGEQGDGDSGASTHRWTPITRRGEPGRRWWCARGTCGPGGGRARAPGRRRAPRRWSPGRWPGR